MHPKSRFLAYTLTGSLMILTLTSCKVTVPPASRTASKSETATELSTEAGLVQGDFHIRDRLLNLAAGDTYQLKLSFDQPQSTNHPKLEWESSDSETVSVSTSGKLLAKKDGTAIITVTSGNRSIKVPVNVFSDFGGGPRWKFSMATGIDSNQISRRTYLNFAQGAMNYESYNDYIAWHGCATCALATVLGAYNSDYKEVTPDQIINGVEKDVAKDAWYHHHQDYPLRKQMPLSLYGCDQILKECGVKSTYVTSFKRDAAKEDILDHLRSGNPVIVEIKAYHTVAFLGATAKGRIIVSDSVGDRRVYLADLDDYLDIMFSCTETPDHYYFAGKARSGGYLKVN